MSMLTAQVDELRTASTWVSLYLAGATNAIPMNTAILLRDAADTIENLRGQLTDVALCHNVAPDYLDFLCDSCGFVHYHSDENDDGDGNRWFYCPNCGRKVVNE